MTIVVRSSSETPEVEAKPEVKSESALEVNSSEQNTTESDTEEKEEKGQDESEDNDSDESDSKDADDKPIKKGGFQRKIDKLTARVSDHAREAEYWKAEALKRAGDPKPEKVDPKPVATEGKPNPDSFDTHAEYVEALTDWKIESREKAAKEKAAKTQLEVEQDNALKSHAERVKSFAEKNSDFSDVLESVDDVPVSPTLREMIITSDNGPALIYELAKNREEFERITRLSPLAAARELGKLEAKLSDASSTEKKSEPKKITSAPKPLAPVGKGGSSVGKSIDDPNLSQADYEKLRAKQMKDRSAS